ncbi:hypothetical protein KKH23_06870 [Patescibacteria group bacterium]|uniref:Uncharacterized protein n=1 Tax=viral metagenome TaxID=1070528 RepID=A0A6M3LXI6_9ZZZZ|nr:hypothetical protein [Patescibacteria group bacterium]MBU0846898.1 hypothetical protein [Patescibacteria group bacterium]
MEIDLGDGAKLEVVFEGQMADGKAHACVFGMRVVLPTNLPTEPLDRARFYLHEILEALSLGYLKYSLGHKDIERIETPLAATLIALGWNPPQ